MAEEESLQIKRFYYDLQEEKYRYLTPLEAVLENINRSVSKFGSISNVKVTLVKLKPEEVPKAVRILYGEK